MPVSPSRGERSLRRQGTQMRLVEGDTSAAPAPPARPAGRRMVFLSPEVLRWARESRGYSVEEAATKFGVDLARMGDIEEGRKGLTPAQAGKLADIYKRPLAVLLLQKPLLEPPLLHDFRRVMGTDERVAPSSDIRLALRRARRAQTVSLELITSMNQEADFKIPQLSRDEDPTHAAGLLREALGGPGTKARARDAAESLRIWRDLVERLNVLVLQFSAAVSDARGFCLPGEKMPVIALNRSDSAEARSFTLFHELVHAALRRDGICEPYESATAQRSPPPDVVEQFCNAVSGRFLVPADKLRAEFQDSRPDAPPSDQQIQAAARRLFVSRSVILRRLLDEGLINDSQYRSKLPHPTNQEELPRRPAQGGGGNAITLKFGEWGRRYTQLVLQADAEGLIEPGEFSDYLELKLRSKEAIARLAFHERPAFHQRRE